LTEKQDKVTVQIRYKELEESFSATMEETWLLLNKFFNDFLPSFEVAMTAKA
jgi:hypothetical protein